MRNNVNAIYYSFGIIVSRIIALVTFSLFSYFLSKQELGFYDLLLNSISFFLPIVSLQLGAACSRFVREQHKLSNRVNDTIKTVLLFSVMFYVIALLVFLCVASLFQLEFKTTFFLIILVSSFLDLLRKIAKALDYIKVFSFSEISDGLGLLFFSVLFYFFSSKGLESIVYAYLCSSLLTTVFVFSYLNPVKWIFSGNFDVEILKELLHFSLPLVPNALSYWLLNIANRYIIVISLGVGASGMYAVASKIPSFLSIFGTVFTLLLQEVVFGNTKNSLKDGYYSGLFLKLFCTQVTSAIVIIAFSRQILRVLFLPIYYDTHNIIPLILAGVLFANFMSFFSVFYYGQKQTQKVLQTTIWGSIVNIVFTYTMINRLGLYAPAIGSLLGFLTVWLIRIKDSNRYIKMHFEVKLMLQLSAFFILMAMLCQISNSYLEFFLMFISVVIFCFYNKLFN